MPAVSRSRAAQNAADAASSLTKPKELAEVTNASIKTTKKAAGKGKADPAKVPSVENTSPAQNEETTSKPTTGKSKQAEAVAPVEIETSGF
jgi:hypothetical protein